MMGELVEETPDRVYLEATSPDTNGDEEKKEVNLDFAKEAARRARLQIFTKHLPPFLMHLKKKLSANHLRRIVLSEMISDDFGHKVIERDRRRESKREIMIERERDRDKKGKRKTERYLYISLYIYIYICATICKTNCAK